MSYRDVNSAQQAIRRNLNSVNLEPENRAALEAVAISMAAAGKPGEFVTYMQALEKTETQVDLKAVADNISSLVNVLKSKEQPEVEVVPEWAKSMMGSQDQLFKRITTLEKK